ncbi:MAG: tetratricopeptide repeat protein [Sulfurimonas sp.]
MKLYLKVLLGLILSLNLIADDLTEGIKAYKNADYKQAHQYFIKASQNGDYNKAKKLWQEDCKKGNAEYCFNIGYMYGQGYSVERNSKKAFEFYLKACTSGYSEGCSSLGWEYQINAEDIKAIELYLKACENGNDRGCSLLGAMYENGYGVEKNYDKALILYKKDNRKIGQINYEELVKKIASKMK